MAKAKIIKYYQVIDELGNCIDNAHNYQQAKKIKEEYSKDYKGEY